MDRYICPDCGEEVLKMRVLNKPPKDQYQCTNIDCDYLVIVKQESKTIMAPRRDDDG